MSFEFQAGRDIDNTVGGDMVAGDKTTTTTGTTSEELRQVLGKTAPDDLERLTAQVEALRQAKTQKDEPKMEELIEGMASIGVKKLSKVLVKFFM